MAKNQRISKDIEYKACEGNLFCLILGLFELKSVKTINTEERKDEPDKKEETEKKMAL